jgi:hypothetical protein
MSLPFTFNFVTDFNEASSTISPTMASTTTTPQRDVPTDVTGYSFCWLHDTGSLFRSSLEMLQRHHLPYTLVDVGTNSTTDQNIATTCTLRQIRCSPTESSIAMTASSNLDQTDLVSGVYEGGLKVWECSVDLCRYFQENHVVLHGAVLEIGCGHGLPGCWALKQARSRQESGFVEAGDDQQTTVVVFTDFNEFVLHSVTIPNIILNFTTTTSENDSDDSTTEIDSSWLSKHVALGYGDWISMSDQLRDSLGRHQQQQQQPTMIPSDGKFDCILSAETTYSPVAAKETAFLLFQHLKHGSGVAYIATKRYYFGVGGGSDCFRHALSTLNHKNTTISDKAPQLYAETIAVYDNGVGNIRELFRVKWVAS